MTIKTKVIDLAKLGKGDIHMVPINGYRTPVQIKKFTPQVGLVHKKPITGFKSK